MVVAGASQTGVVMMRDLVKRSVNVHTTDCVDGRGFHSRYGSAFRCPNPDREPLKWVSRMIEIAERIGGRPVLMCSADMYVSAVARHADKLTDAFTLDADAFRIQSLLATKQHQYKLAAENGMQVARTQIVDSLADIEAFAAAAAFPCLMKPMHSRYWEGLDKSHPFTNRKLVVAETHEQLVEYYRLAESINRNVVVQEFIQGPDTNKLVYMSCYSSTGIRLKHCLFRVIRACPMKFGSASIIELTHDTEADELCDNFLKNLNYKGVCEIELKRDACDNTLRMIEANPRFSGSGDAAAYTGYSLAWVHYLDSIGQDICPVDSRVPRFRHIVLEREVDGLVSYLRSDWMSLPRLIWTYRPPVRFFDVSLRDWRPTMINLKAIVGRRFRSLFGRLLK